MPEVPRPGKRSVYVELPQELADKLDERAAADRRTRTAVVILALEQYLGIVGGPTAPPSPAEAPAPKKRGKRKGG